MPGCAAKNETSVDPRPKPREDFRRAAGRLAELGGELGAYRRDCSRCGCLEKIVYSFFCLIGLECFLFGSLFLLFWPTHFPENSIPTQNCFWDKVSMCNLWLGGIRYVDQASLKLCLLNAGIKCVHHQSPIKIFGFHMYAWFACMYEYHLCAWCLQKPEELSHHSGAGN